MGVRVQVLDAVAALVRGGGMKKHIPLLLPLLLYISVCTAVTEEELRSIVETKRLHQVLYSTQPGSLTSRDCSPAFTGCLGHMHGSSSGAALTEAQLPDRSNGGIAIRDMISGIFVGAAGVGGPAAAAGVGQLLAVNAAAEQAAAQMSTAAANIESRRGYGQGASCLSGAKGGITTPRHNNSGRGGCSTGTSNGPAGRAAPLSLCGTPRTPGRANAPRLGFLDEAEASSSIYRNSTSSDVSSDALPPLGTSDELEGEHLTRRDRQEDLASRAALDWASRGNQSGSAAGWDARAKADEMGPVTKLAAATQTAAATIAEES